MAVGKGKQMTEYRTSPYPILSYSIREIRLDGWLVRLFVYFVFKGGRSPSQQIFQAGFLTVGVSFGCGNAADDVLGREKKKEKRLPGGNK